MLPWLVGLLDRIFAVIGAAVFVQAPLFMQQYTQQLIGRTEELRLQVDAMRRAAGISGKTLDQLLQKFADSGDADFVHQGDVMSGIVQRWYHLSEALTAMEDSSLWSRPLSFLYHLNTDVFKSTLAHFSFGLPISLEGGIYAFIGLMFGYLIFSLLKKLCGKFSRRRTA